MTADILTLEFVLTALMLTGAGLCKLRILTRDALHGLSALLVNVALPCTIMDSFHFESSRNVLRNAGEVFIISALVHLGAIAVSRVFYRKTAPRLRNTLTFATVFSNCGFIGIPLAQGLFGAIGVFYVSIFSIPFNILVFTYGVRLFSAPKVKAAWHELFNPPLVGTLAGFTLFLFSVQLPVPLAQTIHALGAMTTPLSMLVVGILLADTKLSDLLKRGEMYLLALVKLVILPLALLAVLRFLPVDRIAACVCVAAVAMPTASLAGVLAQRYGGDTGVAAQSILFTTLLSAATLPLMLIFCLQPG